MKENEADARLIAAAPDLLKSAKWLLHYMEEYTAGGNGTEDEKEAVINARRAIAAAEGSEPEEEHTGEPDPTDLAREFQEDQDYAAQPTDYDP
jgi:hypothetical protein